MNTGVWTADRLAAMIEKKYPTGELNGYNPTVVLREVANGTGWDTSRWVDIAVFQMWRTKGLTRSAFEIKVTRHDFLRELAQPEKHRWVHESFHEFWFVAPDDIIQVEELPVGAGFMYPRGDKLCIKRHAVRNPDPKLDDILLAAFMRSAWKSMKAASSIGEKELLANSAVHQRAKMYEEAIQAFFNSRRVYPYENPKDKDQILTWLRESTMDLELKKERDHLLGLLDAFQNNLMDAVSNFLVLSGNALLEKDKLGNYLLSTWGGNDKAALEVMGKRKQSDRDVEREKLAEQVRQEIPKNTSV
ncbi:MAG: hypothetical protein Q7J06_06150 [Bacteroidales bacterium]|nr:hypothetical protein [Bacteroidales bacterium]